MLSVQSRSNNSCLRRFTEFLRIYRIPFFDLMFSKVKALCRIKTYELSTSFQIARILRCCMCILAKFRKIVILRSRFNPALKISQALIRFARRSVRKSDILTDTWQIFRILCCHRNKTDVRLEFWRSLGQPAGEFRKAHYFGSILPPRANCLRTENIASCFLVVLVVHAYKQPWRNLYL